MFGLTGVAADVARTKANGEKNALRKTYKGHIKSLGVNGHFDAVKKDWATDPDGFIAMISMPETEWHVHQVAGKEIERGFSDVVQSSLLKATAMAKGPIPKAVWDSSVLGDLAPGNVAKKGSQDYTRSTAPSTPAALGGGSTRGGRPQQPPADRVRRNKKRSYQDSSFEGYGEGFLDDDAPGGAAYSTAEGDDASSKKRRKQVDAIHSSSPNLFADLP